jgi:hypothetical protein
MSKWTFDEETTQKRYIQLKRYYKKQGLNADNFACTHFSNCLASQPNGVRKQYSGGTAGLTPFYDIAYNRKPIRVLVIGKESGYKPSERYGTTPNFDARRKALLELIYGGRNNHIEGTLDTLKKIFQVDTNYIYASYALSNIFRCSFQTENKFTHRTAVRDTAQMKTNCFQYLVDEIKILEPTVLVAQGGWSMQPFVDRLANALGVTFKMLKTYPERPQGREYGLYKFPEFMCITAHHPSRLGQWRKNLAPHSLWPMIEKLRATHYLPKFDQNASAEYEKIVRPKIDKVFSFHE